MGGEINCIYTSVYGKRVLASAKGIACAKERHQRHHSNKEKKNGNHQWKGDTLYVHEYLQKGKLGTVIGHLVGEMLNLLDYRADLADLDIAQIYRA